MVMMESRAWYLQWVHVNLYLSFARSIYHVKAQFKLILCHIIHHVEAHLACCVYAAASSLSLIEQDGLDDCYFNDFPPKT